MEDGEWKMEKQLYQSQQKMRAKHELVMNRGSNTKIVCILFKESRGQEPRLEQVQQVVKLADDPLHLHAL